MKELSLLVLIFQVTVFAGKYDRVNIPVRVSLTLPKSLSEVQSVVLTCPDGKTITGQLSEPGLLSEERQAPEGDVKRELHFILPSLKAGEKMVMKTTVRADDTAAKAGFRWHDTPGEYAELRQDSRPVLRYMYKSLDDSTKEKRELTYKVFHHLFDPAGKRLVTKGPGGVYTHHRGLFYGFNRVTYGEGTQVDIWHCTGDTHQAHAGFLSTVEGPVFGRHRIGINWNGVGKEVFATEEREMTVYAVPGGTLLEFASRVTGKAAKVRLDGDPQHAGFHFRADNEVAAQTNGQTYFLRPDGPGKPGETRNWPGNKNHVNLPWDAMSFILGGRRYTVAYIDKPTNPKEARFSERDYGRFGSYFEYELDRNETLDVNYRIWCQEEEMTGAEVRAKSADFVEPVRVEAVIVSPAK